MCLFVVVVAVVCVSFELCVVGIGMCDFHDGVAHVACRLCWSCDLVCSNACLVNWILS